MPYLAPRLPCPPVARHCVSAVLLLALSAGCAPNEPPVPVGDPPPAATGPVTFERIAQLQTSGFTDSLRAVARTPEQWSELWMQAHAGATPVPDRPAVDFGRSIVVVAAMGQRPSGGYSIAVDSVVRRDGQLVVHVTTAAPGPSCMTTAALTQPVDMVRVNATEPTVTFQERSVTQEC